MPGNALYYPYIHIRDVNWLKGTLLLFPQVRRMLPAAFTPADTVAVQPFTQAYKGNSPLLCPTDLTARRVVEAQTELAAKLERDAKDPNFRKSYDHAAARKGLARRALGFQIHQMKLDASLRTALTESGLAWAPQNRESYDASEYIELHPRVGEAVMSTLAIACSLHEGLDIVCDERSEGLHRCLIEKDGSAVYDAWLHSDRSLPKPQPATGEELFEFMIGFTCDLTTLTPEHLASMHEDREPIQKLVSQLQERASRIPSMDPGPQREESFKDAVSDTLKKWQEDRANMSTFWREFFGEGLGDASAKFLEKVADKVAGGAGLSGVGALVGHGAIGSLASASLIGASAGLAIGVAVHASKSISRIRKRQRQSAYRYLTMMEKAGVVFRSDL